MRDILWVGSVYVMTNVEYLVLSENHDTLWIVDGQTSYALIIHYSYLYTQLSTKCKH